MNSVVLRRFNRAKGFIASYDNENTPNTNAGAVHGYCMFVIKTFYYRRENYRVWHRPLKAVRVLYGNSDWRRFPYGKTVERSDFDRRLSVRQTRSEHSGKLIQNTFYNGFCRTSLLRTQRSEISDAISDDGPRFCGLRIQTTRPRTIANP